MRRLALTFAVLLATAALARVAFRGKLGQGMRNPGSSSSEAFSWEASFTPSATTLCDYANTHGLLNGNYFCLYGDQLADGGPHYLAGMTDGGTALNLTAVGTPTQQTLTQTPCGASGCSVAGERLSVVTADGGGFDTAALSGPSGSFSQCIYAAPVTSATNYEFISKANAGAGGVSWYFSAVNDATFTAGIYEADATSTAVVSSAGGVTAGAHSLYCESYQYVTDGTSALRLYVNGVASGTPSTTAHGPVQASASTKITVGHRYYTGSFNFLEGRIPAALYIESLLTPTQIQSLATAVNVYAPALLVGSRGEAITFTRASAATCTAADGTVSVLPPGRPCVSGGYLSEPAGTNLAVRSDLNSGWIDFHVSRGTAGAAPDGTLTAGAIIADDTSNRHFYYQTITVATATYTVSVFAKPGHADWVSLAHADVDNSYFNVADGGIGTRSASCSASGSIGYANGWFRIWEKCALTAGATYLEVGSARADNTPIYVGDGGVEVYVTGAQYENSSVATSYIPTAAAPATRAATTATVANPLAALNPAPSAWCIGGTVTPTGASWTGDGIVALGTTAQAANTAVIYAVAASGAMALDVYDAGGTLKRAQTDATFSAAQHTVYGCDNAGTLTVWVDGVNKAVTGSGAGTGIVGTMPANATMAGMGSTDQLNGTISNVKILSRGTP